MKKLVPLIAVSAIVVVVAACRKDDQAPTPTTPTASAGYPPQGYPQQGYPQQGYPQGQPTGYPQGQPTAYPQPTGQPTMQPTATATPMGSAGVLPCQSDAQCGLARCNVQIQKCVFPCQNAAVDCIQGAQCVMGACVPKLPGSP
jgi:hypothetical protein